MNSAGEQGVRQTYSQLNHLMQDYPDVQEMLLDLLTGIKLIFIELSRNYRYAFQFEFYVAKVASF